MAFSCSSIRLHSCSDLRGDPLARVDCRSYSGRNSVVDLRGCNVVLKNSIFSTCLRVGKTSYCVGKKNGDFRVRNQLEPSVGSELSDVNISSSQDAADVLVKNEVKASELNHHPDVDNGNGGMGYSSASNGDGDFPPTGSGGGGGNGDPEDDSTEDDEFGPLLKFDDVLKETKARGASLPEDMLEAAKTVGIREVLLSRYFDLQVLLIFFLPICETLSPAMRMLMLLYFNFLLEGIRLATWHCDEVMYNVSKPHAC